jgi:5-hydroxyisourate hydrolase-like protein (transthyretin family)
MGNDTTLTVYSYGGRFNQKMLRFAGKFINTTGTNAKNLWVSLEKKSPTGSWTTVTSQKTNSAGVVVFYKNIDTTYWDVRMAIQGDTMTPGSVFSTADAQKINQAVLGQYAISGFDYYSMDVNGADGNITISDVYSVYGRLAGRFTSWPNSQNDIKFFTVSEYSTINGSGTNYTSTIAGLTNLYYYVDGKDSITYYVNVKGDANGTGFKMARLTPIKITNPSNAKDYIIDNTVQYDNVFETIEINMPKVKVDEGNLVNIPVKVLTNGVKLGAFQLELKYDTALLTFAKIELTEKMMNWMSYTNPDKGVIAFGSADLKGGNLLNDGEQVMTVQFIAKKPQLDWGTASIWTGPKFVGGNDARDMNITPTMGIVEVKKVQQVVTIKGLEKLIVYPNPNQGEVIVEFKVQVDSDVNINVTDIIGKKVLEILNTKMPAGDYKYLVKLDELNNGMYVMSFQTSTTSKSHKIFINK